VNPSRIPPPNPRARRIRLPALCLFLAVVAAAPFAANRLLAVVAPAPAAQAKFNPRWVGIIDSHRPDLYLIGNSMLASRIIPERLGARLQQRVLLHEASGLMSAAWYLMIKNYALAATHRPREVVVFFRDANLTQPNKRIGGKYERRMRAYRTDREPEYDAVMRGGHVAGSGWMRQAQRTARQLHHLLELPHLNYWGLTVPGEIAAHLAATEEVPADAMPDTVNDAFRDQRFRSLAEADDDGDGDTLTAADYDFDANVQRSFLPLMLDAAERGGMHLTFVRVETRDRAEGRVEDARLSRYMQELREYLERHGASLIDMSRVPGVTPEWFSHGDHIHKERRDDYTDLFHAAWRRSRI